MKGHGAKFGRKKEEAIAALLSSKSVEDAARAIGINANTLLRWLEVPEFREANPKGSSRSSPSIRRTAATSYRRCRNNSPEADDRRHRSSRRPA